MDNGNVVNRQYAGIGEVNGLTAHLHGELRSPDDGGADALARFDDGDRYTRLELLDNRVGQQFCNVAVTGSFATEEVFGNAAGKTYEFRLAGPRQGFGQFKRAAELIKGRPGDLIDGQSRQALGDRRANGAVRQPIGSRRETQLLGHELRGMVDASPCAIGILCDQPSADGKSGYAQYFAFVDQSELGRAAADINMQPACVTPLRQCGRTRTVR